MIKVRRRIIGLAVIMLACLSTSLRADPSAPTEYDIKAAFLYNFAKFVEWPPDVLQKSGNFVVGVLGDDPFDKNLEQEFDGKTVQDKTLIFKPLANLSEALDCQVVYISGSEEEHLDSILNKLQGSPVLTVSDMKHFIQRGGMVGFVLEENKVGFNINRTVAERVGLKVSSQLLKLAKTIAKTLVGVPIG